MFEKSVTNHIIPSCINGDDTNMYSYVYFNKFDSCIYCWEFEHHKKVLHTYPAPLYFYIEHKDSSSEYRTIFGKPAKKLSFSKWSEYKNAVEKYKSHKIRIYESDVAIETKFIIEHYNGLELKIPQFKIFFIDIEVHSEEGFPKPEQADYPIKIITLWSLQQKKFFIFAEKDFDDSFLEKEQEQFEKFIFSDEKEMIQKFMIWIRNEHPDVISGWNSNGFDIPYIINRARKLFGLELDENGFIIFDGASQLSPIDKIISKTRQISEYKTETRYEIVGINLLDYLEIFQNYTFSEQESWKLNHIAKVELGESKKEFTGSLADLYKNNWQHYVEYNIQDVRLLKKLENKKKFFNLLFTFCYGCRVPFEHYTKTTKVLDGAFLSRLFNENIVLPDVDKEKAELYKNEKYIGGYVKDPIPGLHEWVMSFDATSLYPSIMMGWNISPETKVAVIPKEYVKKIMKIIKNGMNNSDEEELKQSYISLGNEKVSLYDTIQMIRTYQLCLAANGSLYRTDISGVIPRFVKEWFQKRKEFKKKMLQAKDAHDDIKAEEYAGLQHNLKILINSVYGYLGTPHSRLFDWDNAVAVTMTGRMITTTCIEALNKFFSSSSWTSKIGYNGARISPIDSVVIYGDTDSVYVSVGKILQSFGFDYRQYSDDVVKNFILFNEAKTNAEFFDSLSKEEREQKEEQTKDSVQNIIVSVIEKAMNTVKDYCNLPQNTIFFKREAVASRALFLNAKKHYALWVINSEGVEIEEKKRLKIVGIEIIKSSTPAFSRSELPIILKNIMLYNNYERTISEIYQLYEKFKKVPLDDIAIPSSIKDIDKYVEKYKIDGDFKATPIHIRAAMLYNKLINSNKKLKTKYDLIYSGDKMKYVYVIPHQKWQQNVFAWKDKVVEEVSLKDFINWQEQFKRAVINVLEGIFEVLNWQFPNFEYETVTLDDIF